MKLYDFDISGNCYKVRLLLNLLGTDYERVPVDLFGGEHKTEAYLAINPKGQVPALADGDIVVSDSQAILVYLAKKLGADQFWPDDGLTQAQITYWLCTAANDVVQGPGAARLAKKFNFDIDYEAAQARAHALFAVIEAHLQNRQFLVGAEPTLADIAMFPYIGLCGEGELSLADYPNIQAWLSRIKALPNFIAMPGID
ncbi:glutathione S-transferase family protein [Exilibacterium tricleocarpae]|uniref:Glutathione S-transferase family protein n=1 Tax=Exilibacterium tricleocarpae TaxID=2591008 RepID=A0A545TYW9_9GAMM|nr:glutathione S-transferase family protein [Exilibacterium tricleocarpae]TQV82415.1 glutathione S-transferase family protein [Exilibacterium tricleocarpae]